MENIDDFNDATERVTERDRMATVMDAFLNLPRERALSAMPVLVHCSANAGRVDHFKKGEEHCFRNEEAFNFLPRREASKLKRLNPYAVRDEFLAVSNWSGAYDFLCSTGTFWTWSNTITWSDFQRWQRFARAVQERSRLVDAIRNGVVDDEQSEIMQALAGTYPQSFNFVPEPIFTYTDPITGKQQEETLRELRYRRSQDPQRAAIERLFDLDRHKRVVEVFTWFRRPPGDACSIEWLPKTKVDADSIPRNLNAKQLTFDLLLRRDALRPVLVISTFTTLHAIAAAIFADYCNGIEYRTCEFCNRLFALGRQKAKRFCNKEKCKNAAHAKKVRAALRMRTEIVPHDRKLFVRAEKPKQTPEKGR